MRDKRNLEKFTYTHEDAEAIKKRFQSLSSDTVDRLCEWLKENNQAIHANECYDGQSGWFGDDFMIGKANLSKNGYCLTNEDIELFLRGGQNPQWYHFYDPEFKEAKENPIK